VSKLRWPLLVIYVLVLTGLFARPIALREYQDSRAVWIWVGLAVFYVVSQVLFIVALGRSDAVIPLRARRLLLSVVIAGLLMALLTGTLVGAVVEVLGAPVSDRLLVGTIAAAWGVWTLVLFVACRRLDRLRTGRRLFAWLLTTSVLQLMVTLTCHLVARGQTSESAGLLSLAGAFAGTFVLLWSVGPGIALLFWSRARSQPLTECPQCGCDLRERPGRFCPRCGSQVFRKKTRPDNGTCSARAAAV